MVYVDPTTGRRFAELSDYLSVPGASGFTIPAMASQCRARYVATGNGTSVIDFTPAPVFLGNGPAGAFIVSGFGRVDSGETRAAVVTQGYGSPAANDAEAVSRLKALVLENLGGTYADQVVTSGTTTFDPPVPGRIKVDDSYWKKGSAWQTVHPLFNVITTSHEADPDALLPHNPTTMQASFVASGETHPRWVRWLKRTLGSTAGRLSAWQTLAAGVNVNINSQNFGPGAGTGYLRFTDLDGVGFATEAEALAATGLQRQSATPSNAVPYGNSKSVLGQTSHTINTPFADTFTISPNNVRWNGTLPFRMQIRTAPSLTETGNDWLAHPDVKLWTDVEVYPESEIGPELPSTLEPLVADALPRVTSRIRLRTGIDGGGF